MCAACKMDAVVALLLVLTVLCNARESKYSVRNAESPFRMKKFNNLWDKAKKNLADSPKLATLHQELSKLDKLSIKLKHSTGNGGKDEDLSAKTKEIYYDILNRYGLSSNKAEYEGDNEIKAKFSDKVEKLWQTALYSGKFKENELEKLEQEFKHHEKRIEDYRKLANQITEHDTISDNDIRSLDKLPEKDLKVMRKELKLKHHNLSSHFIHLTRKVKERVDDVTGDFTDSRVAELWHQAEDAGFSKTELDSIKQELRHFQIRIDKHNYWKERHTKMKDEINEGNLMEVNQQEMVSSKVKEHARLVKKYHATMIEKIEKRDEL